MRNSMWNVQLEILTVFELDRRKLWICEIWKTLKHMSNWSIIEHAMQRRRKFTTNNFCNIFHFIHESRRSVVGRAIIDNSREEMKSFINFKLYLIHFVLMLPFFACIVIMLQWKRNQILRRINTLVDHDWFDPTNIITMKQFLFHFFPYLQQKWKHLNLNNLDRRHKKMKLVVRLYFHSLSSLNSW